LKEGYEIAYYARGENAYSKPASEAAGTRAATPVGWIRIAGATGHS